MPFVVISQALSREALLKKIAQASLGEKAGEGGEGEEDDDEGEESEEGEADGEEDDE